MRYTEKVVESSLRNGRRTGTARYFALIIIVAASMLNGCGDFVLWDLAAPDEGGNTGAPLMIAPVSATVFAGSTFPFSAEGGTAPYTFIVVEGSGTVDSETGLYAAPSGPSADVVRVIDAAGDSSDARVTTVVMAVQ